MGLGLQGKRKGSVLCAPKPQGSTESVCSWRTLSHMLPIAPPQEIVWPVCLGLPCVQPSIGFVVQHQSLLDPHVTSRNVVGSNSRHQISSADPMPHARAADPNTCGLQSLGLPVTFGSPRMEVLHQPSNCRVYFTVNQVTVVFDRMGSVVFIRTRRVAAGCVGRVWWPWASATAWMCNCKVLDFARVPPCNIIHGCL